jgi:Cohesin domain
VKQGLVAGGLGAAALALALAAWVASPTGGAAPVMTSAAPAGAAWQAVDTAAAPVVNQAQAHATPAAAEPAPRALPMVPVTLAGAERLQVGEQAELTVAVGAGVGDVALTIRFDPNVLQVRAGAPGAWATGDGHDTRFTAEITEAADQLHLRSAPASRPWSAAGGTVAHVQFEAVGPGSTAVVIADAMVTDASGRVLPVLLSMSKLQVTAEPAPPPP